MNNHSQVLLELIRIVPNARPIHDRLRNVFMTLHKSFKIFSVQVPRKSADMGPSVRAWKAATRWIVMCKHCLRLVEHKQVIPEQFKGLKKVLAAIQLPESKPTAATASVTDSLPALDDTTPQCSMLRTENQQPDPFYMRVAPQVPLTEEGLIDSSRVAYDVPYSEEGIIDWSQVDDDLSAPESDEKSEVVEAAKLDFDRALPSNLHPYYHHREDVNLSLIHI